MSFTTWNFAFYLFSLWSIYWILPQKRKNLLLLLGSYFFYGIIHPWMSALLFIVSMNSYLGGMYIQKFPQKKRKILFISISINLLLLIYFKYFDFFIEGFNHLFQLIGISSGYSLLYIFLPIGISFYVFQGIGYLVDCYRGEIKKTPSLVDFTLFISFFPQLVAGPIERAKNLLPQFSAFTVFKKKQQWEGIQLIIWGVFKKSVIADTIALYVDMGFAVESPSLWLISVSTVGFAIQIFADFSAYTDIARGSAKLFGIELMKNFNAPYVALNPSDFWKRWHISLSEWIRDYIYIPLGGSRVPTKRYIINVLLTMFLCGLWHGAAWTFIMWGVFHGFLLLGYHFGKKFSDSISFLKIFFNSFFGIFFSWIIMILLTLIGWMIFRSPTITAFFTYFSPESFARSGDDFFGGMIVLLTIFIYASPLLFSFVLSHIKKRFSSKVNENLEQVLFIFIVLGSIILSAPEQGAFIYFQF